MIYEMVIQGKDEVGDIVVEWQSELMILVGYFFYIRVMYFYLLYYLF